MSSTMSDQWRYGHSHSHTHAHAHPQSHNSNSNSSHSNNMPAFNSQWRTNSNSNNNNQFAMPNAAHHLFGSTSNSTANSNNRASSSSAWSGAATTAATSQHSNSFAGSSDFPPIELAEHSYWYYRDPQLTVQGPFTATEMRSWYENQYFDSKLPVQIADQLSDGSPAPPTRPFIPLGQWFASGHKAFLLQLPKDATRSLPSSSIGKSNFSADSNVHATVSSLVDLTEQLTDSSSTNGVVGVAGLASPGGTDSLNVSISGTDTSTSAAHQLVDSLVADDDLELERYTNSHLRLDQSSTNSFQSHQQRMQPSVTGVWNNQHSNELPTAGLRPPLTSSQQTSSLNPASSPWQPNTNRSNVPLSTSNLFGAHSSSNTATGTGAGAGTGTGLNLNNNGNNSLLNGLQHYGRSTSAGSNPIQSYPTASQFAGTRSASGAIGSNGGLGIGGGWQGSQFARSNDVYDPTFNSHLASAASSSFINSLPGQAAINQRSFNQFNQHSAPNKPPINMYAAGPYGTNNAHSFRPDTFSSMQSQHYMDSAGVYGGHESELDMYGNMIPTDSGYAAHPSYPYQPSQSQLSHHQQHQSQSQHQHQLHGTGYDMHSGYDSQQSSARDYSGSSHLLHQQHTHPQHPYQPQPASQQQHQQAQSQPASQLSHSQPQLHDGYAFNPSPVFDDSDDVLQSGLAASNAFDGQAHVAFGNGLTSDAVYTQESPVDDVYTAGAASFAPAVNSNVSDASIPSLPLSSSTELPLASAASLPLHLQQQHQQSPTILFQSLPTPAISGAVSTPAATNVNSAIQFQSIAAVNPAVLQSTELSTVDNAAAAIATDSHIQQAVVDIVSPSLGVQQVDSTFPNDSNVNAPSNEFEQSFADDTSAAELDDETDDGSSNAAPTVAWSAVPVAAAPPPKSLLEIQKEEEELMKREAEEAANTNSSATVPVSLAASSSAVIDNRVAKGKGSSVRSSSRSSALPRSAAWASAVHAASAPHTSLTDIQQEQQQQQTVGTAAPPSTGLLSTPSTNHAYQSIKLITPIMPADVKTLRAVGASNWVQGKSTATPTPHANITQLRPGPSSTPLLETPTTVNLKSATGSAWVSKSRDRPTGVNPNAATTNNVSGATTHPNGVSNGTSGIMSIRPKSMLAAGERPTVRLLESSTTTGALLPTPPHLTTATATRKSTNPSNPTRRNGDASKSASSTASSNTNGSPSSGNGSGSAFGGPAMSPEFSAWCIRELDSLTGSTSSSLDLPQFLMSLDDSEVTQYIHEYLGTGPQVSEFAEEFIRYKQFENQQQTHTDSKAVNHSSAGFSSTASVSSAAQAADAARARRRRKK